ncbi:uncharacterized protein [Cicer arietinum]|uniref:Uncharacterized protein LOC101505740 n=1 Tax=Cicer arietinum TaxID=3827 RepID=A0A1S2XNJ0_CICAR|nr:uncharacterized protein LOC101505740 [Cicer arietinum]
MKPKGLIVETLDKWGVKLSTYQAYRTKGRAIEMIQGARREQYAHLREYADELRRSNPNSIFIIKPLIWLDACFLKREYDGQLIAVVGKHRNNQMIPIAYAIVEADWYMSLPTLGPMWNTYYVLNTFMEIGKTKYPGGHMKELLWLASTATVVRYWEKAMRKIKAINEDAWKDMMQLPPSMWTRSAFRIDTQCLTAYWKTNFLTCYSYIVMPSNGPKLWQASNVEHINSPIMRRSPGRPKKKRNKSNDKPKGSKILPRQFVAVKCKNCRKLDHNTRTCKGKNAADREIPKGGNNVNKTKKAKTTRV